MKSHWTLRICLSLASNVFIASALGAPLDDATRFHHLGLDHLAWQSSVEALRSGESAPAVKHRVLTMMMEMRRENPAFSYGAETKSALRELMPRAQRVDRPMYAALALAILKDDLAQGQSTSAQSMLGLLAGLGPIADYARGLIAAAQGNHAAAIEALDQFLNTEKLPDSLLGERDNARLLVARAHYAQGNFATAAGVFAKISNRSAEFAEAIIGRGWSELQSGHYPEALGAATNFEVGMLKTTFQPEALSIKAMGLNELCQFPESLKSVRQFQQSYRDSFQWLKKWSAMPAATQTLLYPHAVEALKGSASKQVPAPLARAWSRSATFLAEQAEIHSLFREEAKARAYLTDAKVKAFVARAPELRRQATARINRALAAESRAMLARLNSAAENLSLVQVEIYNGASHDMIFRNANPQFSEMSEDWKLEAQPTRAARVWNWGSLLSKGEKTEVWQDEVGSLQANLSDQCANKQKYLQLKGQIKDLASLNR